MFMYWINLLLDGMGHGISWLQRIEIVDGVSVWSFVIGCIIIGVIITGLLNLVNRPPIGTIVSDKKSDHAYERAKARRKGGG